MTPTLPNWFDTVGNIGVFVFIGLMIWLYLKEDVEK